MEKKKKFRGRNTVVYSQEQLIKALHDFKGKQALMAKKLGVSSWWVSVRINEDPVLRSIRDDYHEQRLDNYEIALDELMEKKDVTSIIFFLKTQGRRRGYSQDPLTEENLSAIKKYLDMQKDK